MKIEFENEPFAVDKWWAGEMTLDIVTGKQIGRAHV